MAAAIEMAQQLRGSIGGLLVTRRAAADLIESQAADLSRLREERDAQRARTDGAALIAAERQRQLSDEGWTPEHDAEWVNGELASAAICYARSVVDGYVTPFLANAPIGWPWHEDWWKPSNDLRNLVRAGALIAAEIDRRLPPVAPSPDPKDGEQ